MVTEVKKEIINKTTQKKQSSTPKLPLILIKLSFVKVCAF